MQSVFMIVGWMDPYSVGIVDFYFKHEGQWTQAFQSVIMISRDLYDKESAWVEIVMAFQFGGFFLKTRKRWREEKYYREREREK